MTLVTFLWMAVGFFGMVAILIALFSLQHALTKGKYTKKFLEYTQIKLPRFLNFLWK